MSDNPASTASSLKRPASTLDPQPAILAQTPGVNASSSFNMQGTAHLLMSSPGEAAQGQVAKRQRLASPSHDPIVSSAVVDATVSIGPATTTSTNSFETAFDIAVLSIVDTSAAALEWERLAGTTYMDAGRLDATDRGFVSAPVRSDVIRDADGNRLLVYYNQQDEVLPILSVFAYFAQYSDRLDAQRFRFGFRQSGRAFKIRLGDDVRPTAAGGWLTRWLHWGGRGAVSCRSTSIYTDSPFLRMFEEVNYERRLSVMVNRYCRQLEAGVLTNADIKIDLDLCCIDFPFDRAWFIHRVDYWVTDFDLEVRARQMHRDQSARVLVGWHNVELFASRPQDRAVLYVGVDPFDWFTYWSHRFLGVPTPPVLSYYSNLVLRPNGAQRHLIRTIALTEFAVCSVKQFLSASRDGILSFHRLRSSLRLNFSVILPVFAAVQEVVAELNFFEIIRDSKFDAVAAIMAWRTVAALNWDELAKLDAIPHVYFDAHSLAGFLPSRSVPYLEGLCPNRSVVEREVMEYYGAQESNMGTVVANSAPSGPALRSVPPPSVAVSSARVIASSGLASAAVNVHPSSSHSAQVPMVSTTVAVASSVPRGQPSPSGVVEHSSAPPLLTPGDTVSEDLQGPLYLIREQREAATRLAASRLADLESVRNDLAVAFVTVSKRNLTVERLRSENAQVRGEVSRLTSEVGAADTLRAELEASRRRLADRDAEVDRLRAVLTSPCNAIDSGLADPDKQA